MLACFTVSEALSEASLGHALAPKSLKIMGETGEIQPNDAVSYCFQDLKMADDLL